MKLGCYPGIPRLHPIPLAIMFPNFFLKETVELVKFKKKI